MRYAHKSDAAVVCAKLKAMSKLIAFYPYLGTCIAFISNEELGECKMVAEA
jgi:hypothetical protein